MSGQVVRDSKIDMTMIYVLSVCQINHFFSCVFFMIEVVARCSRAPSLEAVVQKVTKLVYVLIWQIGCRVKILVLKLNWYVLSVACEVV